MSKRVNNYGRMLDQIELCYKQYTPPQIAAIQPPKRVQKLVRRYKRGTKS